MAHRGFVVVKASRSFTIPGRYGIHKTLKEALWFAQHDGNPVGMDVYRLSDKKLVGNVPHDFPDLYRERDEKKLNARLHSKDVSERRRSQFGTFGGLLSGGEAVTLFPARRDDAYYTAASYAKLPDGSWGARLIGTTSVGSELTLVKGKGSNSTRRQIIVTSIVMTGKTMSGKDVAFVTFRSPNYLPRY